VRFCILCGKPTPSDADNTCYDCLDWFKAQDRKDLERWPAWLRKVEIWRHLDHVVQYFDPKM